jgi:Short C-terminal domain
MKTEILEFKDSGKGSDPSLFVVPLRDIVGAKSVGSALRDNLGVQLDLARSDISRISIRFDMDVGHISTLLDQIDKFKDEKVNPSIVRAIATNIDDPLKVLKLRFAKGEITKEQYEEMRKMLES